jgi:hypothetical protein
MRQTSRVRGTLIRAAAASALLLGTVGLAVAPAQAIGGCAISPASMNVTIGVTQTLNVVDCNNSGQVGVTYANGSAPQTLQVYPGVADNALASWVPSSTGAASLSLSGSVYATANVAQTPTTTIVAAPNNAKVGAATQITVTVQSNSPSAYPPTGQVVVKDINGATLATMGLTAGPGNGQSYAYYWWTPPTAGTYTFQATYSGDTNATKSVSPQDVVIATPSGSPITLTNPAQMTQGVPVTLTATVYPTTVQGSVGFTLNGAPISASVPLVNGVASFLWNPNVLGAVTIGASYMTNGGGSGSTSNKVTVVAGPVSNDVITLTQPGFGSWAPNGTYTVTNGTTVNFTASTLSGAAVTLSETGPCQVSGLNLIVDTSNATCNLVASSPGGNGYAPVKYGYTVSTGLGQQTATLAAPISGRVNVGKTLTLESPAQGDTNAGQNIVWRVTKGKTVCALGFPQTGAVTLKIKKRGQCTVRGNAPGVPNVWAPYVVVRSYQAR